MIFNRNIPFGAGKRLLPVVLGVALGAGGTALAQTVNNFSISPDPLEQQEGSGGGTTLFQFTVTRSDWDGNGSTLSWSVQNGTTDNSDFNPFPAGGTLTFDTDANSTTVDILVSADDIVESDENFFLIVTPTANATILDGNATGTIQNDDNATISINDVSLPEGDPPTPSTPFEFTVSLSNPVDEDVTVTYNTADGTAQGGNPVGAGDDYESQSGSVTFPAFSTGNQTITIRVIPDIDVEADEDFFVNLTGKSVGNNTIISQRGARAEDAAVQIHDGEGRGLIINDDLVSITATKEVTGPFDSGEFFNYTIILTNNGVDAQPDNPGPEFEDTLPPEVSLHDDASFADSGTLTTDNASNYVRWDGVIPAGESVKITIVAMLSPLAKAGEPIENQGTAFFDNNGGGTNDQSVSTDDPTTTPEPDPTVFVVGVVVPTLSFAALLALFGVLAAVGGFRLRRRK